jgi:hypothetical protein
MIKDTVEFTDYTVKGMDIAFSSGKRWQGVWPRHWQRVMITVPRMMDAQNKIFDWLEQNNRGRYGVYQITGDGRDAKLRIAFENGNDALMFKLRGGHKAYDENE